MLTLSGVIPACVLPFGDDYSVDAANYQRHLRDLTATPGVTGIVCNGHAGEVTTLSRDEWRESIAIAAETINGAAHLITGIYAETHRDAAHLARIAAAEGADAALVCPPNLLMFDANPEVAYQRFAEVASATDLPLVVFAYPARTGMDYDEETMHRICAIPTVVGIKDWTLDIGTFERNLRVARAQSHHVAMLSSFSTHLLPTLVLGADGILSGHGSVVADLHVKLFELVGRNDTAAAAELYERLQLLTRVIYRAPLADMYTRMKEQLVMLGRLRAATVRPPLIPLLDDERDGLRAALVAAGLLQVLAPR